VDNGFIIGFLVGYIVAGVVIFGPSYLVRRLFGWTNSLRKR